MREASVKPLIPPSMFPAKPTEPTPLPALTERPTSNTSKRRTETTKPPPLRKCSDDLYDDGLDDDDWMRVSCVDLDFEHIENFANPSDALTKRNTAKNAAKETSKKPVRKASAEEDSGEPIQLENGKWTCGHKCGDKTACKHLCCREGLDRPPKKAAKKASLSRQPEPSSSSKKEPKQTKLQLTASKRKVCADIETLDLTQSEKKRKSDLSKAPRDIRNLNQLHKKVLPHDPPVSLSTITHKKPAYCYAAGGDHDLSFLGTGPGAVRGGTATSTDYGDLSDDLQTYDPMELPEKVAAGRSNTTRPQDYMDASANRKTLDHSMDASDDEEFSMDEGLTDLPEDSATAPLNPDHEHAFEDDRLDEELGDYLSFDDGISASDHLTVAVQEKPQAEAKAEVKSPLSKEDTSVTVSPFFAGSRSRNSFKTARTGFEASPLQEVGQSRDARSRLGKATEDAAKEINQSEKKAKDAEGKDRTADVVLPADKEDAVQQESGFKKESVVEQEKSTDPRLEGLDSWLLEEFGDIIEVVDEM